MVDMVVFNNGDCGAYMVSYPGNSKTLTGDISMPAGGISISIGLYHLAYGSVWTAR